MDVIALANPGSTVPPTAAIAAAEPLRLMKSRLEVMTVPERSGPLDKLLHGERWGNGSRGNSVFAFCIECADHVSSQATLSTRHVVLDSCWQERSLRCRD